MLSLILVSQSPQRLQLLKKAGFFFQTASLKISEKLNENINLDESLQELARRKSEAFLRHHKSLKGQDFLLLSADTLVCLEKDILTKPKNEDEAISHLTRLSACTHQVKTAVCFYHSPDDRFLTFVESTQICFHKLKKEDILSYIKNYKPFDKSGAYGIQEIESQFVKERKGSLTNVIGLPMEKVLQTIKDNKWNISKHSSIKL